MKSFDGRVVAITGAGSGIGRALAGDVVGQFGRVDVLVTNAGVAVTGDFGDLSPDDMEWLLGINFWGVVHATQGFLPHLIASGDGHIVMMSSLSGLMCVPRVSRGSRRRMGQR